MDKVLEIAHVSYTYEPGLPKAGRALDDVSFFARPGERIALLGANGSGKSTLLSCIDTLLIPDQGHIVIGGRQIGKSQKDRRYARENVGYVFQDPDRSIFCADLYEELSFGCLNAGFSKEKTRRNIEREIERLALSSLVGRPTYALSGGQKKLVTLAAVLAMDPRIILLDEPETGLDPIHKERLLSVLDELRREGQTVLLSTHDMDMALAWADRWLILRDGRIDRDGPAVETAMDYPYADHAGLTAPSVVEDARFFCQKGILTTQEAMVRSRKDLRSRLASKWKNQI